MSRNITQILARRWAAIALLASAVMLALAHGFQTFGGLEPCHLCLQQRDAYWAAAGLAAATLLLRRFGNPAPSWPEALLAAVFAAGAAIAIQQAGAEWRWWPGPASCSGVSVVIAADILRGLDGAATPAPRCDQAAWVFLGLSMAGWNALVSLGLAAASAWAAWRNRR